MSATARMAVVHFHADGEVCPNRKGFSDYREAGSCVGHEIEGAHDLAVRLAEAVLAWKMETNNRHKVRLFQQCIEFATAFQAATKGKP